jgi:hypothetical protein
MVTEPVAKEPKVFNGFMELSHQEGTVLSWFRWLSLREVFLMEDPTNTTTWGVKNFVKREFSNFLADPLFYAIDRWIGALFLALAISILASAVKMLVSAGTSLAN